MSADAHWSLLADAGRSYCTVPRTLFSLLHSAGPSRHALPALILQSTPTEHTQRSKEDTNAAPSSYSQETEGDASCKGVA